MRLVGELNALYNHWCVPHEDKIYCALKHTATALVLSAEVDGDLDEIYMIIELITKNKVRRCQGCTTQQ